MSRKPVSPESSDEELMQAVCLDEVPAFGLLYGRYKGRIISFTRRLLQNQQKAEDATQEIFLRILKKKKTYNTAKKFSGWLYSIAANICIDELRRLKFSGSNEEIKYQNAEGGLPVALALVAQEREVPVGHAVEF